MFAPLRVCSWAPAAHLRCTPCPAAVTEQHTVPLLLAPTATILEHSRLVLLFLVRRWESVTICILQPRVQSRRSYVFNPRFASETCHKMRFGNGFGTKELYRPPEGKKDLATQGDAWDTPEREGRQGKDTTQELQRRCRANKVLFKAGQQPVSLLILYCTLYQNISPRCSRPSPPPSRTGGHSAGRNAASRE